MDTKGDEVSELMRQRGSRKEQSCQARREIILRPTNALAAGFYACNRNGEGTMNNSTAEGKTDMS